MRVSVLASLLCLFASPALAQERWVVVRSGTGDATEAERTARGQLAVALGGTGLSVLADAEAATRVEDYHSTEPSVIESDRIEELRAAVTSLEEHAALRQREAARAEAERIRELSEGLSADLAEQSEVAERLFAACVAEAWLHIQLREREEARQILQQCRELHPDVSINPVTVAPPVVEMLRAIDAELARRPTFALTCAGVPAGCELRLDGRRRAVAPEPIGGIVPGAHRVEIVCEGVRRRRVHRVIVGAEDRTLPFDPRFDDVLLTRDAAGAEVRLDYPSEADEREHRIDDAVTLAGVLEVTTVVLASRARSGLRFDRIDVPGGRVVASVVVDPAGLEGPAVLRAATALLERRSVDLTGAEPVAIRPWPAGEIDVAGIDDGAGAGASSGGVDAAPIVGLVLGGVAVLAYTGSWVTYAHAYELGEAQLQVADPASSPDWARLGDERSTMMGLALGVGLGSSTLATATLPLWLPQAPGEVPWWSLVVGGVGLCGVIPAAIAFAGDGVARDLDRPWERYDTELTGALWLSGAAPLVSVPLVYLIRLAVGPSSGASAAVDLGRDHALVTVGGRF